MKKIVLMLLMVVAISANELQTFKKDLIHDVKVFHKSYGGIFLEPDLSYGFTETNIIILKRIKEVKTLEEANTVDLMYLMYKQQFIDKVYDVVQAQRKIEKQEEQQMSERD